MFLCPRLETLNAHYQVSLCFTSNCCCGLLGSDVGLSCFLLLSLQFVALVYSDQTHAVYHPFRRARRNTLPIAQAGPGTMHLDADFVPLAPGKLLLNPERPCQTGAHRSSFFTFNGQVPVRFMLICRLGSNRTLSSTFVSDCYPAANVHFERMYTQVLLCKYPVGFR